MAVRKRQVSDGAVLPDIGWIDDGVADSYLGLEIESEKVAASRTTDWLRDPLHELRDSMRLSEAAVR